MRERNKAEFVDILEEQYILKEKEKQRHQAQQLEEEHFYEEKLRREREEQHVRWSQERGKERRIFGGDSTGYHAFDADAPDIIDQVPPGLERVPEEKESQGSDGKTPKDLPGYNPTFQDQNNFFNGGKGTGAYDKPASSQPYQNFTADRKNYQRQQSPKRNQKPSDYGGQNNYNPNINVDQFGASKPTMPRNETATIPGGKYNPNSAYNQNMYNYQSDPNIRTNPNQVYYNSNPAYPGQDRAYDEFRNDMPQNPMMFPPHDDILPMVNFWPKTQGANC
jgi:hypothetical protein